MTNLAKLFITVVLGIFAAHAVAKEIACEDCNQPKQESSHREKIRLERAKYDRENEKATTRPWDVIKKDEPRPDKDR